ncbi:MAG: hypothetical protein IJX16_03260 [Clostridia bacterium]|nr:hypothetical protein [Clostridia bacterium]MBQ8426763.1 hypothetical protein [Clostridia bacterium]
MEKIYGVKESDIVGLIEFIKDKGNKPLSQVFESYAIKSKKAKGTVRNLYYAIAKLSNKDQEFCDKYLNGKALHVESIVEFEKTDETELIKKVLLGKKEGRSVRSVIMEMANGDGKLALRYQNKYRNAVKFRPKLVSQIIAEIKGDEQLLCGQGLNSNRACTVKNIAVENILAKIRGELESIIFKATYKTSKENEFLKARVVSLEKENAQLNKLLYGENRSKTALKILHHTDGKSLMN